MERHVIDAIVASHCPHTPTRTKRWFLRPRDAKHFGILETFWLGSPINDYLLASAEGCIHYPTPLPDNTTHWLKLLNVSPEALSASYGPALTTISRLKRPAKPPRVWKSASLNGERTWGGIQLRPRHIFESRKDYADQFGSMSSERPGLRRPPSGRLGEKTRSADRRGSIGSLSLLIDSIDLPQAL